MAPEPRGQKRRREPQGASRAQADAPRSRTRRAVNESRPEPNDTELQTDLVASQRTSKRRRLDPNDGERSGEGVARAEGDQAGPQKKKRGRPSRSTTELEGEAPMTTKKRGRQSKKPPTAVGGESPTLAGPNPKQKRGRPSLSEVAVGEVQNQGIALDSPKISRKRGRPSLSEKQQRQSQSASKQARRSAGTGSLAGASKMEEGRGSEHQSEPQARRTSSKPRPRKSRHSTDGGGAEAPSNDTTDDMDTRHKGPFLEGEYQYITERMVTVSRSKISAKWSPLDIKSITAVNEILLNAQRPVLYHLRNGRHRQEHAAKILSAVTNRVQRKLDRGFPFPAPAIGGTRISSVATGQSLKSGHAEELDYERVVDAAQALENQLNPTLHAVALLSSELKKQEKALEDDYKSLRTLENNARDEARSWKKSLRTAHVLAPETKTAISNHGGGVDEKQWEDLELVVPNRQADGLHTDHEDEELLKFSQQICSHMESIQSNLRQVEGILPAMERSRAALHEILLTHLDSTQCGQILLG